MARHRSGKQPLGLKLTSGTGIQTYLEVAKGSTGEKRIYPY